jgi:hypothetical protein
MFGPPSLGHVVVKGLCEVARHRDSASALNDRKMALSQGNQRAEESQVVRTRVSS